MSLKNHRSGMTPNESVNKIQKDLIKHGAKKIMMDYDDDGQPVGITFMIQTAQGLLPIKIPARIEKVEQIILNDPLITRSKRTKEQALITAWANIRDWVLAQMALLETDMVKMEEIFLPYIVQRGGKTIFERLENNQFLLPE